MQSIRSVDKDREFKRIIDLARSILDTGSKHNKDLAAQKLSELLNNFGKTTADLARALHLPEDELLARIKANVENYNFRAAVENARSILNPQLGRKEEEALDLEKHMVKSKKNTIDLARALSLTEEEMLAKLEGNINGHTLHLPRCEEAKKMMGVA